MVEFFAHNIKLDDGTTTKPEIGYTIDQHANCISAKRLLTTLFPRPRELFRLADLGCLDGGYSVEFARMGFQVVGLDVRQTNISVCNFVRERVNLPNLSFVCDDVWNIAQYGQFDAVFCCGLLYHLERPNEFLRLLSSVTSKLIILQTHFSTDDVNAQFNLTSTLSENEGLRGRWYQEYEGDLQLLNRENCRGASWSNKRSFWVKREYLLQAIIDAGFDICMEQFDNIVDIPNSMSHGYYKNQSRGTFVGIKVRVD